MTNDELTRLRDYDLESFELGFAAGFDARDKIERPEVTALVEACDRALRQWEMYCTQFAQDDLEDIDHAEAEALRVCKKALDEYRQAMKESK